MTSNVSLSRIVPLRNAVRNTNSTAFSLPLPKNGKAIRLKFLNKNIYQFYAFGNKNELKSLPEYSPFEFESSLKLEKQVRRLNK